MKWLTLCIFLSGCTVTLSPVHHRELHRVHVPVKQRNPVNSDGVKEQIHESYKPLYEKLSTPVPDKGRQDD